MRINKVWCATGLRAALGLCHELEKSSLFTCYPRKTGSLTRIDSEDAAERTWPRHLDSKLHTLPVVSGSGKKVNECFGMSLLLTWLVGSVTLWILSRTKEPSKSRAECSCTLSFSSSSPCSFKRNKGKFIDYLNQIFCNKINTCFKDLGEKQRK